MGTSSIQDRQFNNMLMEHLRNDATLEKCIEWIRDNMSPEDVFRYADLEEWAMKVGFEMNK